METADGGQTGGIRTNAKYLRQCIRAQVPSFRRRHPWPISLTSRFAGRIRVVDLRVLTMVAVGVQVQLLAGVPAVITGRSSWAIE